MPSTPLSLYAVLMSCVKHKVMIWKFRVIEGEAVIITCTDDLKQQTRLGQ